MLLIKLASARLNLGIFRAKALQWDSVRVAAQVAHNINPDRAMATRLVFRSFKSTALNLETPLVEIAAEQLR